MSLFDAMNIKKIKSNKISPRAALDSFEFSPPISSPDLKQLKSNNITLANADADSFMSDGAASAKNAFNSKSSNAGPISDPIKSSFSSSSSGSASSFILNPTKGTVDNLDIGIRESNLVFQSPEQKKYIDNVASKLNTAKPVTSNDVDSILEKATATISKNKLTELYGNLEGKINDTRPFNDIADVSHAKDLNAFQEYLDKTLPNITRSDSSIINTIKKSFTSGLPKLADKHGKPVGSLPTDMDPNVLEKIKDIGLKLFKNNALSKACDTAINYSDRQNMFNGLISMSMKVGAGCTLLALLENTLFANDHTKALVRDSVNKAASKGFLEAVSISIDYVGAGTVPHPADVVKKIFSKTLKSDTSSKATKLSIANDLNVKFKDVYVFDKTLNDLNFDIIDTSLIKESNSDLVDSFNGNSISKLTQNTRPIEIPQTIIYDKFNNVMSF